LGAETPTDVLVMSAGPHDATYGRLNFKDISGQLHQIMDAAFESGYDRVVWKLGTAVHKAVPHFADCSSEADKYHMVGNTCEQIGHYFFTPPRVQLVNSFVQRALAAFNLARLQRNAPLVEVLDAYKISSAREDATGHRDLVHYCPVVYHAITQVLLHQLCGCDQ
jgi:hypothetical protein